MLHVNHAQEPQINQDSHTECYTLTVHGSHTLIKIPHWMLHVNRAQEPNVNQDLLRAFPVYFVPLQSNSTQCNMHSSCVATEHCMKCGFSYETDCWRNFCEESFWINLDILCRCRSLTMVDLTECCMLTVHRSHTLRFPHWMLHINCAWEPHINQDSHIECCTLTVHGGHTLTKIPTLNATC